MADVGKTVTVIDKPIVGYSVHKPEDSTEYRPEYYLLERPEELTGSTYKISPTNRPHSYYLTVNNYKYEDGRVVPFEAFVNSKNAEGLDKLNALMLVISGVLRDHCSNPHGNPTFIIKQLQSVISYEGPYIMPGGKRYSSVVGHIAEYLEKHFIKVKLLKEEEEDIELSKKRETAEAQGLLHGARQCSSCGKLGVVKLDGCDVCLECNMSKC